MSSTPSLRTANLCVERAESFRATALGLAAIGDEWFAVCYFYSAYHLVKAALIDDPVFDSIKQLSAIDGRLTLEDRFMERHQGRMDGRTRTLGLNDIVSKLYPAISIEYRRLHMASVAVRYSTGLSALTAPDVVADFTKINDKYFASELRTGM